MPSRGRNIGGRVSIFDPGLDGGGSPFAGYAPALEAVCNPTKYFMYREDFAHYDATNDWTLTQATAGTGVISTTIPGALTLDAGSTTVVQGPQIQQKKAAFIPAANKSIWYEATVLITSATLAFEAFIGLAAVDTTIIATSAMSTNNRIGWTSVTHDGVMLFDSDKAGTGTTKTGVTIVSGTAVNFGFIYDGGADTLQQYINGVATSAAIATANIPKLVIYPSFVCQSGGTDQPTMSIMGLQIIQQR